MLEKRNYAEHLCGFADQHGSVTKMALKFEDDIEPLDANQEHSCFIFAFNQSHGLLVPCLP